MPEKMSPELEDEIIVLSLAGASQFRTAIVTEHEQAAVRRVKKDYDRFLTRGTRVALKPSQWAEVFHAIAQEDDTEEIEWFLPVPNITEETFEKLFPNYGNHTEPGASVRELMDDTRDVKERSEAWKEEESELLKDAQEVFAQLARNMRIAAEGNPEVQQLIADLLGRPSREPLQS